MPASEVAWQPVGARLPKACTSALLLLTAVPMPAAASPPVHTQVEDLDLALRKKDEKSALAKLETTKASLDKVLAAVL